MAQARGTSGKNDDKESKKLQNLDVKEEKKKKSEEQKSDSSSSYVAPPIQQPIQQNTSTTNTSTNLSDRGYESTTNQSKTQIGYNNMATNLAIQRLQEAANARMLATLQGKDVASISSASKTVSVYNTATGRGAQYAVPAAGIAETMENAYRVLPTSALVAMQQGLKTKTLSSEYAKEVMKAAQAAQKKYANSYDDSRRQAAIDAIKSLYHADKLYSFDVSYLTAAEYIDLEKEGYQMVYIEDGIGDFEDKDGVLSIGRDHLSGVPKDVKLVFVDKNGNWKYIANTASKANLVDMLDINQGTECSLLLNKIGDAYADQERILASVEHAMQLADKYEAIAEKTRSQKDIDNYNRALKTLTRLQERYNESYAKAQRYAEEYAAVYNKYTTAKTELAKWTAEDEAQYQLLKQRIENRENFINEATTAKDINDKKFISQYSNTAFDDTHHASLIAAYMELSKRREKYGDCPVFLNSDTIQHYADISSAMGKAVEQYNIWDSCTIHPEKGESVGALTRQIMVKMMDLYNYDPTVQIFYKTDPVTGEVTANNNPSWLDWYKLFWETVDYGSTLYTNSMAIVDAVKSPIDVIKTATAEYDKAKEAYKNKKISYAELAGQNNYIFSQCKSVIFSNVMANLDVFDTFSIQKEYAAFVMARHPDRYSDDPKWQKLQNAYKEVYGTDYRGKIDAVRMAYTMLEVERSSTTTSDYIYLDASDLRNKSGSNYNLLQSVAVGFFTDIMNWVTIPKAVSGFITTLAGGKALRTAAADALKETLINSGVTKEYAEEFITSSATRKLLRKATYKLTKQILRDDIDDVAELFIRTQKDEFLRLALTDSDEIAKAVADIGKDKFLLNAVNSLDKIAPDAIGKSFALTKGVVITKTLRDVDNALQDLQMTLFKITCPAAGAVTVIWRGIKHIKALAEVGKLSAETLQQATVTGKQAMARIAEMNFDSALDSVGMNKLITALENEFYLPLFNKIGTDDISDILGTYKEYQHLVMRSAINNYTNSIVTELTNTLKSGGIDSLLEFAQKYGYDNFDDMYSVLRNNLNKLQKYSSDTETILKVFDNAYNAVITSNKVADVQKIIDNINEHLASVSIRAEIYTNKDGAFKTFSALFSPVNVAMHPEMIQDIACTLSDDIKYFASTLNPDLLSSENKNILFDAVVNAEDALDAVSLGYLDNYLDNATIEFVDNAVSTYYDSIKNIYIPAVEDFQKNIIYDSTGGVGYLDNIGEFAGKNFRDRSKLVRELSNKLAEEFKEYNISAEEISQHVLRSEKEIDKLGLYDRQTMYSIMPHKGANVITQTNNKEMEMLTDMLTDSNSQLSRTLRLLEESSAWRLPEELSDVLDVDSIIQNASAMEASRVISKALSDAGVDGVAYMTFMDSISGNPTIINSIVQSNSPSVAADKIVEAVLYDATAQVAKHNGAYEELFEYGANTVDVAANTRTIEKIISENSDVYAKSDKYIDIVFSMNKSAKSADPSDIAFHILGSDDDPIVFRNLNNPLFVADSYAGSAYGKSADAVMKDYYALSPSGYSTTPDMKKQIREYIEQQKELALSQNKTIRFIGFNSSDAFTGNNKYINDLLRASGANISASGAIDFADVLRGSKYDSYIFTSESVAALKRSVESAIDIAKSRSATLGIAPAIAYDPKITCAGMLEEAFKAMDKINVQDVFTQHIDYIKQAVHNVTNSIDVTMYNELGDVMTMYVDFDLLRSVVQTASGSSAGVRKKVMRALSETSDMLGLHKIMETSVVDEWIDLFAFPDDSYNPLSKAKPHYIRKADSVYSTAQRLNQIRGSIRRFDCVMYGADLETIRTNYKTIYKKFLTVFDEDSFTGKIARAIKLDDLDTMQLYSVNRWFAEQLQNASVNDLSAAALYNGRIASMATTADELDDILNAADFLDSRTPKEVYDELMLDIRAAAPKEYSLLSDSGYNFLRTSVVDYTDTLLDPCLIKYLDNSEEAVAFARQLNELFSARSSVESLDDFKTAVNALFTEHNKVSAVDKITALQSASVMNPILRLYDSFENTFNEVYATAKAELLKEGLDDELVERIATQRAANAWSNTIQEWSLNARKDSVKSVLDLNEKALKTHLIRNCCGGLVIDPNSAVMQGIDLDQIFERWRAYGLNIDSITFSNEAMKIKNRMLFRITVPELFEESADDIFKKYNHAAIDFHNASEQFNNGMRHASFGGSDYSLMNASHIQSFNELFFADKPGAILDLSGRFSDWADELYSCNMWTDADLKQLINPYYSDNAFSGLAQSTHQVRKNISAVHDLGSVLNSTYMKTSHIVHAIPLDPMLSETENTERIIMMLKKQNQRVCRFVQDGNKFKLVDYTSQLSVGTFNDIIENTICIDKPMYDILSDWNKATNIALKMQRTPEFISQVYKLYRDCIRSPIVNMWLYGNVATGIRNMVDSTVKAVNEVLQSNASIANFFKNYVWAVNDAQEYSNVYRNIEVEYGCVDSSTIAQYFKGNLEELDKFNLLYVYEHTCGGDTLSELTAAELRKNAVQYIMDGTDIDANVAEEVSKAFDSVYGSIKYRGLSNAQIKNHLTAIHDDCMKKLKGIMLTDDQIKMLDAKFYGYHPVVQSWGDTLAKFPILKHNKAVFNNAETRARLALYKTFMDEGLSVSEAMEHVISTQFHYAGLGHLEDFFPFTQYMLYNAVYWFDHADARAISTAWRTAQYNGDGAMTSKEISDMCGAYRMHNYFLYDQGKDAAYDQYVADNRNLLEHVFLDGVDSYLGVPREFQAGSLDLNGTHYIKLGNSFVEEMSLVLSCGVGAYTFAQQLRRGVDTDNKWHENLRAGYEALKYTPLYDKFYSPWKSYIDFMAYCYDRDTANTVFDFSHMWQYYNEFVANKDTHSLAVTGIPLIGAIITNVVGRAKAFNLNLGELMAMQIDPTAQQYTWELIKDMMLNVAGATIPSLVGTHVTQEKSSFNYYVALSQNAFIKNPATYFDMYGRLQKEMGYTPEEAKEIMQNFWEDKNTEPGKYLTQKQYFELARELFTNGFSKEEIKNIFAQHNMKFDDKRFLAMYSALPDYIKYDKDKRNEVISYYKSMGMSTEEAWAKLLSHPALIINGKLVELSRNEVLRYNEIQKRTYFALQKQNGAYWTSEDWDAFNAQLRELGFYYPKGEQKRIREYYMKAGYSFDAAQRLILNGFMLNKDGILVDVQGQARRQVFSYNSLQGAEWDAYWETVPNYTKYEKGAFGRTMKALKKMGYSDEESRAWIQMGIYVNPEGIMMNVTGMERPVLGYPSFNAYYQTLPDYIKYEKGAFSRTYAVLKQLGFDYDTSLRLIQQGAYLMDASLAMNTVRVLGARRAKNNRTGALESIAVTDINSLLLKHGGQPIVAADGKTYMLVNCTGMSRPRRTFSYSRGGRGGYSGYSGGEKNWKRFTKSSGVAQYTLRKPFITQGNVSSYAGFTNYRGSNRLTKPYTTKGYVSTYSAQNFLDGASYGMRKVYKVDMRQFKTGAMSTKKAYPAAYRNIAVAYRHSLYKDLYAKYGASRMMMRANVPGYSNASIVRLRRNEIYNRERYAERRDQISKLKTQKKKGR